VSWLPLAQRIVRGSLVDAVTGLPGLSRCETVRVRGNRAPRVITAGQEDRLPRTADFSFRNGMVRGAPKPLHASCALPVPHGAATSSDPNKEESRAALPGGMDRPFPRLHGSDKCSPSRSQTRAAGPVQETQLRGST
jgi:hypothetical protein